MSWVPAYEVQECADSLLTNSGNGGSVAQTMDRIALQLWVPVEGTLILDKRANEADVRRLTALARQNELQVLLGVYNAYSDVSGSGFSWDRAKKAFAGDRDRFVQQIIAEMEKFELDGVEIDIESECDGLSSQDRADYAGFIIALAREVHSESRRFRGVGRLLSSIVVDENRDTNGGIRPPIPLRTRVRTCSNKCAPR